mmetsp:Transcript_166763/g.530095  ORF Transcript_166763/g.530095 Transcript_166763/m.530095 type:complete len:83 (+) Transcript_166763:2331-2579(+)
MLPAGEARALSKKVLDRRHLSVGDPKLLAGGRPPRRQRERGARVGQVAGDDCAGQADQADQVFWDRFRKSSSCASESLGTTS